MTLSNILLSSILVLSDNKEGNKMKATILTSTVSILILALSGCTQHDPNLPQHKPEATFKQSKGVVKDLIIGRCVDRNGQIDNVTDSQVICSKEDISLGTMLMVSSRYGTTPRTKLVYTIYSNNGGTKVRINAYSEATNAYGKTTQVSRNDQKSRNAMRKVLVELGGR